MGIAVLEKLTPTEKRFLDALEQDSRTKAELPARRRVMPSVRWR